MCATIGLPDVRGDLADRLGGPHLLELELGAILGVAPEVAGEQERVELGRLHQLRRHPGKRVGVLLGSAREVDRIEHCGAGRELGGERPGEGRRELGHLEPRASRHGGADAAMTSAVGEDDDSTSGRRGTAEKRLCGIDHLARRGDALDPRRPTRGIDDGAVAGQGSCVRANRTRRGRIVADGQDQHGLAVRARLDGGAHQRATVAEVLDVEHDQPGLSVAGEVGEQIRGGEVGLIAERGEAGEPEALGSGQLTELEGQIAALGDQADRARRQRVRGQLELLRGVEHPEAVGSEQHSPRFAHPRGERSFEGAGLGALAGAGADGHDRPRSSGQSFVNGSGKEGDRYGDDDQLGRAGHLGQRGIGRPAEQLAGAAVDQIYRSPGLTCQRATGQPVAPLARVLARPEDSHRGRGKQRAQRAGGAHRGGGSARPHASTPPSTMIVVPVM